MGSCGHHRPGRRWDGEAWKQRSGPPGPHGADVGDLSGRSGAEIGGGGSWEEATSMRGGWDWGRLGGFSGPGRFICFISESGRDKKLVRMGWL